MVSVRTLPVLLSLTLGAAGAHAGKHFIDTESSVEHFFDKLEEAMAAIRLFQPDALVLSLGFDIYHNDIQAKVAVTTEGFCRLGNRISRAGLPMLVVQEGGYDLEALSINVQQYFKGLTG